jgi:hypothetical protein
MSKICEFCGIKEVMIGIHGNELKHCSKLCKCRDNAIKGIQQTKKTKFDRYGDENYHNIEAMLETKHNNGAFERQRKKLSETFSKKTQEEWNDRTEKTKKTYLERIGFEWNSKSPEHFKKQMRYKLYKLPSGKIAKLQGYEHVIVDRLLNEYKEEDLLLGCTETPTIKYYDDIKNKWRIYYPDILIKSKNLIIEVKSQYTYNFHKEINKLKELAVLEAGYDFEMIILPHSKKYDKQIKNLKRIK